ncbi:MAG: sulfite exporter TauE/SafE family protein [Pirellulales bacterium]|nr:sulfite exporter TauE/SafE family protein [Pirellulales bacterium]
MSWEIIALCAAALAAGAVNSVAGGGTLITFPVLVAALKIKYGPEAEAVANETSTVALVPGAIVAALGYRRELVHSAHWMRWLLPPSLVGGIIGAILLNSYRDAFRSLVPWLIFSAAMLFALQPQIARWTGIGQSNAKPSHSRILAIVLFQLLIGIYGGYFGAGIGILMLSALAMIGLSDIHAMNALKNVLGGAINGVTAAIFILWGNIDWGFAVPMLVASVIGGYLGARIALKIDRTLVRRTVVLIGFGLALYYFYREFME